MQVIRVIVDMLIIGLVQSTPVTQAFTTLKLCYIDECILNYCIII